LLEKHSKIALRRSLSKTAVSLYAAPGGHEFTFHNKFVEIYKLYPGNPKFCLKNFGFYGLDMELVPEPEP
jgi:hypothetical protein